LGKRFLRLKGRGYFWKKGGYDWKREMRLHLERRSVSSGIGYRGSEDTSEKEYVTSYFWKRSS
jgi:hypothetical protein